METDRPNQFDSPTNSPQNPPVGAGWWIFPALLAGVILVLIAVKKFGDSPSTTATNRSDDAASWTPSAEPAGKTVGLTIDFGNGARRTFDAIAWKPGMTVGSLMEAAVRYRPAIRYVCQGQGADTFLTSLEGVSNQGDRQRNWIYEVDGKHGEVSFAVQPLQPGERVLWIYRTGE